MRWAGVRGFPLPGDCLRDTHAHWPTGLQGLRVARSQERVVIRVTRRLRVRVGGLGVNFDSCGVVCTFPIKHGQCLSHPDHARHLEAQMLFCSFLLFEDHLYLLCC